MLARIHLKNYQSHKDTVLDLHPGVNVILGDSMAGKTSIFRSVRDLKENRPLGLRRRSWFAEQGEPFEIMVSTAEGTDVALIKNENGAVYRVGGTSLTGFGPSVPEEVTKALRLTDLNIQEQLEPYFFICSSPPEVAREINQIMRIERVDEWVTDLTTRLNSVNKESTILSGQIRQHKTELDKIPDLQMMEKDIAEADTLEKEMFFLEDKHSGLVQLQKDVIRAQQYMEQCGRMLKAEGTLAQAESYAKRLEALEQKEQLILFLQSEYKKLKACADFIACEPLVEECEQIYTELQRIEKQEMELDQLRRSLVRAGDTQNSSHQEMEKMAGQLASFMKQVGKCPLCLSDLISDKIENVLGQVTL